MFKKHRFAIFASILTAVICLLGVTAFASAGNDQASTSASRTFTKKQTKAINKMINKAVKKAIAKSEAKQAHVGHAGFYGANTAKVSLPSSLSTNTTVLTKTLPAGKFIVNARVSAQYYADAATDKVYTRCTASDGTTTLDQVGQSDAADQFILLFAGATENLPLNFTIDSAASTTITISCTSGYDDPGVLEGAFVDVGKARINAVQVSGIS